MGLKFQSYIPSTGKFQRTPIKRRPKPLSRPTQLQRSPLAQSWTTTDQVVDLTESDGNSQANVSEVGVSSVAFAFGHDKNALVRQDEELHTEYNTTERMSMSMSNEREPTEISMPPHPPPSSSEQPSLSRYPSCNHPSPPLVSPSRQNTVIQAKANEQPADQSPNQPDLSRDLDFTRSPRVEPTDGVSSSQTAIDSQETDKGVGDEVILSNVKKPKRRIRYGLASKQSNLLNTKKPFHSSQAYEAATQPREQSASKNNDIDLDHCIIVATANTSSSPKIANVHGNWEIDEIIGKELITGVLHYLVRWKSTLMPNHEIELVRTQWGIDGEPSVHSLINGIVHHLVHWKPTLTPEHEIDAPGLIREFEARCKV
ncbi:hypothetical protein S40293_11499 [Stachybotrys chartarum IBT 40293]|nr:hypothetical protein S40293_11499 [Stachybotrys chartarum IBT 40293]